jgi:hypothetical protein
MSLKSVQVSNLKGLKDGRYDLKPVTYVCGGNRSGKSALLQGIQYSIFGRCEEIGAKGAGALVRSGSDSCSVVCEADDGMVAKLSLTLSKKGSVSQSRVMMINGMQVSEAEAASQCGNVPVSIDQFRDLTGEEVWRLIMPVDSASGEGLPEHIKQSVGDLMKKLTDAGFSTADIALQLGGELDCFSRATQLLEQVNISLREVREKARAILKAIETAPQPYDGPSLEDLKLEQASLKSQINQFTEMATAKTTVEQTIAYNNSQIERLGNQVKSFAETQQQLTAGLAAETQLLEQCQELLARMPDFVDPQDFSSLGFFTSKVGDLLECIRVLNPEHELIKVSDKFVGLVQEYVTQNTYVVGDDEHLDNLYQTVREMSHAQGLGFPAITRKSIAKCIGLCEGLISQSKSQIDKAAASSKHADSQIANYRRENESLQDKLVVVDEEKLQATAYRLQQVTGCITRANEYSRYLLTAQDARNQSTKLKSLEPYFEQLVEDLQSFRVKAMNDGIGKVCEIANQIITYCDLSPVVIEPVAGKRPSVVIKNTNGSVFAAMSGAERLIYGSSIILAIHAVRNVVRSLLFLEGGELDSVYTNKFVLALTRVARGNVFIAHWHDTVVGDTKLEVIHV